MYKSFSILRFRGLSRCSLEGMRRVTILTGKNNAGKTAVLESLLVHCGDHNPNLLMVVNAVRGLNKVRVDTFSQTDAPWLSVFTDYDDSRPIKLSGEVLTRADQYELKSMTISPVKNHTELTGLSAYARNLSATQDGMSAKVLKLELSEGKKGKSHKHFMYFDGNQTVVFPPPPMVQYMTRLISPHSRDTAEALAEQFARLQVAGKVGLLVNALKEIEPRLTSLELVFNGEPMIHGNIGLKDRRLIPLALMGDGVMRVAAIILALGSATGGLVLVDDIDTGIHHSVMPQYWASIMRAAEVFDAQVVATTHSDECVRAALSAASEIHMRDSLSLIRMERQEDRVNAYAYDSDEMDAAFVTGLEVR